MPSYRKELIQEIKKLKVKIEEKSQELNRTRAMDPKFDTLVSELNDLRTQLHSKKSRLEHHDKPGYIPDRITGI